MWTLPNIITLVRICFTPVIALLPFIEGYWPKLICFVIFLAAAVSDVYDGHLARSRNEVTDLGKLLDPIADKLLLFATLIPIYFISRWRHDLYDIPIWGSIPLWVCLLLIGRELAMTGFRWWAKRRGVVIPAGGAGKLKTDDPEHLHRRGHPLVRLPGRPEAAWAGSTAAYADYWNEFHGGFVAVTLAVAAAAHRLLLRPLPLPQPRASSPPRPRPPALQRRSPMNIELVTIGTELLLGFTLDTNGAEIARALCGDRRASRPPDRGGRPPRGDPRTAVADALRRTGAVLTTGGLGPTRDDISKKAVAELYRAAARVRRDGLGRPASRGSPALRRTPVASNREPGRGAPGRHRASEPLGHGARSLARGRRPASRSCCPGVPSEMRKLLEHEVVPRLAARAGGAVIRSLRRANHRHPGVHPGRAAG